jgi:hypothetical protein
MSYHTYNKVRETIHESQKSDKMENVLQYCRDNRFLFIDKQFQPNKGSLAGNPIHPEYQNQFETLKWCRPAEVFRGQPYSLFNDIDPNDILQGGLGDCYFLCAMASIAEHPDLVRRLFDFNDVNENGVHSVWLNINGVWKNFILDEYFPCSTASGRLDFAFSKTNEIELWVMLLEKAYAKAYGSYWDIVGGDPAVALRDLTGAPFERIDDFKNVEAAWKRVMDANNKNYVLTCFTKSTQIREEKSTTGIVSGHAYSILDVQEIIDSRGQRAKLLQIRNPWGKFEWKGDFSDDSNLWTPEARAKLKILKSDDGIFWMRFEDFFQFFQEIGFLKIIPNYFSNNVIVSQKIANTSIVRIHVPNKTHITLSVDQIDSRIVDDPNYNYSLVRMTLGKLAGKEGITFIDAGFSGEKSQFIETILEAGDYIVLLESYWTFKMINELVFGTYSENEVELELLPPNTHLYKSAEYFIWKNFAKINKSQLKLKQKQPQRTTAGTFDIENYSYENHKNGMILNAYFNTSPQVAVHQTYKFTSTGIDAQGRNATNQQADIIINPSDWDVILLKFDFRSPKVTLGYRFEDQEIIPYKFSEDTSMLELLNLIGGRQPTIDNQSATIVSRMDKLKNNNQKAQKKSDLEVKRKQRQEENARLEESRKQNRMQKKMNLNNNNRNMDREERKSNFFGEANGNGYGQPSNGQNYGNQTNKAEECRIF